MIDMKKHKIIIVTVAGESRCTAYIVCMMETFVASGMVLFGTHDATV